jgi:hypothetical protein
MLYSLICNYLIISILQKQKCNIKSFIVLIYYNINIFMKKILFLITAVLMITTIAVHGQVRIGANVDPHPGTVLDLTNSSNLGLKLPVIHLNDVRILQVGGLTTDANVQGMLIYNSFDNVAGGNGKGIYVWDGAVWVPLKPKVQVVTLQSFDLSSSSLSIEVGKTITLTASNFRGTDGNLFTGVTVTWSVTAGTTTGSVTQGSYTTTITAGNTEGFFTVKATANGVERLCTVTVTAATAGGGSAHIGKNDYNIYCYGSPVNACWMVQNSKEGTAGHYHAGSDSNYYSTTERTNACPAGSGWVVPTMAQYTVLANYINNTASSAEKDMWLAGNNALAGYYINNNYSNNADGSWWTSESGGTCEVDANGNDKYLAIYTSANYTSCHLTVRCIKSN